MWRCEDAGAPGVTKPNKPHHVLSHTYKAGSSGCSAEGLLQTQSKHLFLNSLPGLSSPLRQYRVGSREAQGLRKHGSSEVLTLLPCAPQVSPVQLSTQLEWKPHPLSCNLPDRGTLSYQTTRAASPLGVPLQAPCPFLAWFPLSHHHNPVTVSPGLCLMLWPLKV